MIDARDAFIASLQACFAIAGVFLIAAGIIRGELTAIAVGACAVLQTVLYALTAFDNPRKSKK